MIAPAEGYDDAWFWEGVRAGRLLVRECSSCGRLQHPPTPLCPRCGAADWHTREATGRGRVYTWILSHHPTEVDAAPRIVTLVELDEGVRLVSNLVDIEVADVRNDMPVDVCFIDFGGMVLPQFRPRPTEQHG